MYGRIRGGMGHVREEKDERWVREGIGSGSDDGMCYRYYSF